MASKKEISFEDYLEKLRLYVLSETGCEITIFVGKTVSRIDQISKSYTSACILKSLEAFRGKKNIYYYDDETSNDSNAVVIQKNKIDELLASIMTDEESAIRNSVDLFYEELNKIESSQTKRLNINYLLFQLIHVATELDSEVDQQEILRFIAEHSSEEDIIRGSKNHMVSFCLDYAHYLSQLRKNISGGVLLEIEKEVRDNYDANLTLRDLGRKYFINSSYLGQMFQKKHGQSFKDYLTSYRISKAEGLLMNTELKIVDIAEKVGYKDTDYFIKKFIEANGCTPSKYRKNKR